MEFGVLGPVEVRHDDMSIPIRRGIPRLVLAALILRVGETLSPDWLAEVIWGDDQPANPANALQTHVSYLRRTLAQASDAEIQPIVSRAGGYILDVPLEHVDSVRFLRAVERARRQAEVGTATALNAALAEVDRALGLWRGEPFADAGERPFVVGEATRLTEARLTAVESRLDYMLALGRHREAVVELGPLVATHPLRERFYEQLMTALYRAGRQAEALRTYERARAVLLDELGLDPSPGLQRLERLMLEQAGELDWVPPAESVPLKQAPARSPTGGAVALPSGGRVPAAVSRLIGRDAETARVAELLARARLVTLTGPGGVGKTSLAAEIARAKSAEHDVWFVDLGGVNEDALVPLAVAAALGTPTQPEQDPVGALSTRFGDSPGLLVVDTCEHVLGGAAAVVSGLLAACPGLRILTTSRRPLGVRGERTWPVPPLPVPPEGASTEDLLDVPSIVLFTDRATAARPDFSLTDGNAADVAGICAALDGLPLAIELAAARADCLSASAIRERLRDRFGLLVDGGRDASRRHATLRSTIEWSFNLLSVDERRLFVRLSAFAGPFGLDETVAVAGPDVPDAVRLLGGLVRQSMVAVVGDDQYQLLDTPREYGREILTGEPDAAEVYQRHARLYVDVATVAADGIWSAKQAVFVAGLRDALPNLRAAIEWSLAHGQEELAARIVGALAWFFMLEGMFTEGLAYLQRLRSADERLSRSARARLAYGAGLLTAPLGRLHEAKGYCEAGVRLAREGGDIRSAADALAALSVAEWALGDVAGAAAHQDESIELYDHTGDPWRRADILVLRARTAVDQRDPAARKLLEEAIRLARSVGDQHAAGMALAQLSQVTLDEGDYAAAAGLAVEALEAHEALKEPEATAGALHLLGRARRGMGDFGGARSLHARGLRLASSIGHVGAICESIEDFAALAADEGDPLRALGLLEVAARERQARRVPARRIDAERVADLRRALEAHVGEAGRVVGGLDRLDTDEVVAQLSRDDAAGS